MRLNLSGHANADLERNGFTFPGTIMVDPTKSFADNLLSVTEYLKELGVKTDTVVTCALPGMSYLATVVIVAIHGLTGQFPKVAVTVRNEEGQFVLSEIADVTELRNSVSRSNRPEVKFL